MMEPPKKVRTEEEEINGIKTTTVIYESSRLKTGVTRSKKNFKAQKHEEYSALLKIKDIITSETGEGVIEYEGKKISAAIDRSGYKPEDVNQRFMTYDAKHHFFDDISDKKLNEEALKLEETKKIKKINQQKNRLEKKLKSQQTSIKNKQEALEKATGEKKAKINKAILGINNTISHTEVEIEKLSAQLDKLTSDFGKPISNITPKEKLIKSYEQLFWLCKLAQKYLNEPGDDNTSYENAYKILVLFGGKDLDETFGNFCKYLKSYILNSDKQSLIHDTFAAVTLPINKDGQAITLNAWRKLFSSKGAGAAIKLFAQADKIEAKKAEVSGSTITHLPPNNLNDALELKRLITYKRSSENEALADLGIRYNIPEKDFNKCLDLIPKQKKKDNLPNIRVQRLEENNADYWLVKLPNDDLKAYFLGKIVNDCQYIGGETERCVIDGITRENHGFYVLLKNTKRKSGCPIKNGKIDYENYEIVGQCYAWLSYADNLVLDSWENLRPETEDPIIIEMLAQFGKAMPKEQRILVGSGGRTPIHYKVKPDVFTEQMKETDAYQYVDSEIKKVVYESEELLNYKKNIQKEFEKNGLPPLDINQLETKGRIEKFLKFIENKKDYDLVKAVLERKKITLNQLRISREIYLEYVGQLTLFYLYPGNLALFYQNLIEISDDKIFNTLTSLSAFLAYNYGVLLSDLVRPPLYQFVDHLIHEDLVACYKAGIISFSELKKIRDPNVIHALVATPSLMAYETGEVSFSDLKDIKNHYVIEALVSEGAIKAYKSGNVSFSDLKDIKDPHVIMALVSDNAIKAYNSRKVSFSDLKKIKDFMVICALTSDSARRAYENGKVSISNLKDIEDFRVILALVSDNAIKAYESGTVKFSDLKEINDPNEILARVSPTARGSELGGQI